MGSGLGLVSDKTHRVLSSLVGETFFWQISSNYHFFATFIKLSSVCFAGVSHGAMLSWPAEVLPQVKDLKVEDVPQGKRIES